MNKVMPKTLLFTASLLVFAGIPLMSAFADNTDVVDEIGIGVPMSCTLSGSGNNSHTATIPNGIYSGTYSADGVDYTDGIGTTTLTAMCNDNEGFAIYAAGYTGDEIGGTNSTNLVGTTASGNSVIVTGTNTGPVNNTDTSNWAMKLSTITSPTPTYPITIDNGYNSYSAVPSSYTKVAHRDSATDVGPNGVGSTLTTTYAAYISKTQPADTYSGKVIYTLVHPSTENPPLTPQVSEPGKICYYPNAYDTEGTMGCQTIPDSGTTDGVSPTSATLLASNFSREGYGFAGWSKTYDYSDSTGFLGPQEDITFTEGQYSGTNNGLSLYAIWIKSAGTMQANTISVCNSLTAVTYDDENDSDESTWSIFANLSSVSALTDNRDGQTYAIAKLTDGNCWMIENLRLADTHQEDGNTVPTTLTTTNTNNPLNDGTTVTLKHNYTDTATSTNLSANSDVTYNVNTAPDGWCTTNSAACDDQSRLRTDNTANRATGSPAVDTGSMYSYGNYYNWYSATAGRGLYGRSSGSTVGDLCPTGWHLPTGAGSGEFGLLSNSLGGYKDASGVAQTMTTSSAPTGAIMSKRLRHFPNNLLYSSNVSDIFINYRGNSGYYLSSTAHNNSNAYSLGLSSSGVHPGTSYSGKYNGGTVRCIATTPTP